MSNKERTGPLQDLTVIDCTMAFAGPFGTSLLADMGADVIKVEPPRGDTFRMVAPLPDGYRRIDDTSKEGADYGASFASVNANKRSICLDLKQAEDKAAFLQLCEQADVVVENMRAGVMDELGLSYEVIAARNPKIVYGAVRGYGDARSGKSPYNEWPCLDVAGQAAGGMVEACDGLVPFAISDIYPGTLMALGILAAVNRAQKTGEGEFLDVAMYDSVMTLMKLQIANFGVTGVQPGPGARALVPFGLFPASDGRVSIAAPVERHWKDLCHAMGRDDLISDERTRSNRRRARNAEFANAQVAAWTSNLTKQQIVEAIGGKVPVGPANTLAEVLADPHVASREMIDRYDFQGDVPGGVFTASPIKFLSAPTGLYQRPPNHGEHTDEVFAEFGIGIDVPKD